MSNAERECPHCDCTLINIDGAWCHWCGRMVRPGETRRNA